MYIVSDQVCKWRLRKKKNRWVGILNKWMVMTPLVILTSIGIAMAAPTGGEITGGSGGIAQVDSATNINQESQRLDINWQTFSTEVHESVNFYQPNTEALAINRVIGGVPSELHGALNANGRIFILNESGITFHGTSQINVGALLATTATSVDEDGDRLIFSGGGYGSVINHGTIHVSNGGFAILAAPYVENTGIIQANLGQIQLASTKDFSVDLRGDGLINFSVSGEAADAIAAEGERLGVDNSGTLEAQSGTVNISANLASDIVQSVVNLDGVVDASAFAPGDNGGAVLVTSTGDTNIGGEIHVDGGASGNGGTVYTWADGTNHVESGAVLTARGGEIAGDGGLVEVSGNSVIYRGTTNASAPNGEAGTLLIDPSSITIADGAGTDSTATVYEQNIETTSVGGTNVDLIADHSITMEILSDNILQGGNGSISMTVTNGGTISFVDKNDTIATRGGSITLSAYDGSTGEGGGTIPGAIDIGNLQTTRHNADITLNAGAGGIKVGNLCTGGTGTACGVHGVNDPGDIKLTTGNGGSITTGNINIHAELYDSANANLDINAAGDLTVGNVSVVAIDPTSPAHATAILNAGGSINAGSINVLAEGVEEASANLDINAEGEASDITLTGGITVSANALDGGDDSADAYASGYINADHNVTINGGISVVANAVNNIDSSASARADFDVYAGNDINISGNISAKADATISSGNSDGSFAYAYPDVELYADNNVTVNGNITVQGTATNNGSYASSATASAYLTAQAGGESACEEGCNLTINGNIVVTADASVPNGQGESGEPCGYYYCYEDDYAYASASADLYAGNNVKITGNINVEGTALYNAPSGSEASANAYLDIYAGNDLNITGNTLVSADATLEVGIDDADASASAYLYAGHDVNISGNVIVQATSLNEAPDGSSASAEADLYVNAEGETLEDGTVEGGNINITGDILVKADTTSLHGYDSATASASAELSAGNDMVIIGDITVIASAIQGGSGSASASASASLDAYKNITVKGDITVQATADNNFTSADENASSARADADLDVNAEGKTLEDGTVEGGNINIEGDIVVKANATLVDGTDTASASASLDLYAGNNMNITGDIKVEATALNLGSEASSEASASASADIVAHNNVTINGDITVLATAVHNGTEYSASADADLDVTAEGGDLNITGDILVKADASVGELNSSSASASATADLYAHNNMTINGDITVQATAVNNGTSDDAEAEAYLYAEAYAGDLKITGNILVDANATVGENGDGSASAYASADLSAGHDVTILTDPITVRATALNEASSDAYNSASASAYLYITAGTLDLDEGEGELYSGDIYITGDISATADAKSINSTNESGSAYVELKAPDNLTIRGADPLAYAPSPDDPAHARVQQKMSGEDPEDTGEGVQFHAELVIDAGGIISIEPKPAAPPPSDDEVAIVSGLEAKGIEAFKPLEAGGDPLRIGPDGLALWATGSGVTAPPTALILTAEFEKAFAKAIAEGKDPTELLPAPAAVGEGLSTGRDAYTIPRGPDICDQINKEAKEKGFKNRDACWRPPAGARQ